MQTLRVCDRTESLFSCPPPPLPRPRQGLGGARGLGLPRALRTRRAPSSLAAAARPEGLCRGPDSPTPVPPADAEPSLLFSEFLTSNVLESGHALGGVYSAGRRRERNGFNHHARMSLQINPTHNQESDACHTRRDDEAWNRGMRVLAGLFGKALFRSLGLFSRALLLELAWNRGMRRIAWISASARLRGWSRWTLWPQFSRICSEVISTPTPQSRRACSTCDPLSCVIQLSLP